MLLRKNKVIKAKYPEIGRLYKGSPKGSSSKYAGGDDLGNTFRIEIDPTMAMRGSEREGFANLKEDLEDRLRTLYGGNQSYMTANEITIRFPFASADDFWQWSNRVDTTSRSGGYMCTRQCDGVTTTVHAEKRGNELFIDKTPIPCAAAPDDIDCPKGCKPKGRLEFIIHKLGYSSGVFVFPVNSGIDVGNVQAYLNAYAGDVDFRNLLFKLARRESSFNAPKASGGTVVKKNYEVTLSLDTAESMRLNAKALSAGHQQVAALMSANSDFIDVDVESDSAVTRDDVDAVEASVTPAPKSIMTTLTDMLDRSENAAMVKDACAWASRHIDEAAEQGQLSKAQVTSKIKKLESENLLRFSKKKPQPIKAAAKAIVDQAEPEVLDLDKVPY